MTITVKIVPRDGKWLTACEINFVVEDVFSAGKQVVAGGYSLVVCGNSQSGVGNQFNVGGRK